MQACILCKARIALKGEQDKELGVPVLLTEDIFAEKLLANADRCQDRSVAYRDAFDLGVLVEHVGSIPQAAIDTAIAAYGPDIQRKLVWVTNRLVDDLKRDAAAEALLMDRAAALRAISELRREVSRLWPEQASRNDI